MKNLKIISIFLVVIAAITIGVCSFIYYNKKSELEDAQKELQAAAKKNSEIYNLYNEIDDARRYQ